MAADDSEHDMAGAAGIHPTAHSDGGDGRVERDDLDVRHDTFTISRHLDVPTGPTRSAASHRSNISHRISWPTASIIIAGVTRSQSVARLCRSADLRRHASGAAAGNRIVSRG